MSSAERPLKVTATPNPSKSRPQPKLSEEDHKELALLDSAVQRLKKSIPAAPYILSTPSLHPYSHYSRHEARAWMIGHLFEPNEEHLQYRTFYYREPYIDCFVLQQGEEDEPEVERPKSQAPSTPYQGPKKKISLSAYKSKQANGVITPGSKKLSPNLAPSKAPTQTNGVKDAGNYSPRKQDEARSLKRPAAEALIPEKPEKRVREGIQSHQQPPKVDPSDLKMNPDRSAPSNATPHGLPPLLSPVGQTLNNPYGLPAILSPTLPSNVQAELDRLETQRKRGDSNASTSSSDRKSQLLAVPDSQTQKREEDSRTTNRARSISVNSKSPSRTSLNRGGASGPSLLVKLKYGKRLGATISKLLRLPPSRKAPSQNEEKERQDPIKERTIKVQAKTTDSVTGSSAETPTMPRKGTSAQKVRTVGSSVKAPEKRPRNEDDVSSAVPSKRPKSNQDGPTTPSQQVVSSPALSNKSSAQKSQGMYTTPRKDHKAVSMLRANSSEGYDVTPGRTGSTPSSAKHLDPKAMPTSAPLSGKKQVDYQSLSQTSQKLNNMGRKLKHDAQKIFTEKEGKVSKDDQKRAAVTSLECILSYLAAYQVQDQSNHLRGRPYDVEGSWKTLWPLCMSYARYTKEFPHLDGFRHYLSAVISAAICAHVSPRASRNKAHDSPQDTSDLAKQFGNINENFILLAEHYQHMARATQDARMMLPIDDIQKTYPKTWGGRELNSKLAKVSSAEKLSGSNLSGPYFLPLQNDTTPIQAVRFGIKFLNEYCDKENLDYSLRVNLEKP